MNDYQGYMHMQMDGEDKFMDRSYAGSMLVNFAGVYQHGIMLTYRGMHLFARELTCNVAS